MKYRDIERAFIQSHARDMEALEEFRCTTCGGSGELNDADFGDIMYNTWPCEDCNGSGLKDDSISESLSSRLSEAQGDREPSLSDV